MSRTYEKEISMNRKAIIKTSITVIMVLGTLASIASSVLGFISFSRASREEEIVKIDRFSCMLRWDEKRKENIWTVMYDNDQQLQAWLGIVIPMSGGWTPAKRCEEIERRLEIFREDGLVDLFYRRDPKTPNQEVICVKTEISGDNCPLLLTLDVGIDGYEALREMTAAFRAGDLVYQGDEANPSNSQFFPESPIIYLDPYFAPEDRR